MNTILLNHRIHNFRKMKENEIPELKRKNADQMIETLAAEDRITRLF